MSLVHAVTLYPISSLSYSLNFRVKPQPLSLRFVIFLMAPRPNPRRLHPAHPYSAETNARASSCWETRTQYFGSPRLGSFVETPPPDRNILFLVGFQDLQDLAHLRHPDHQECSPIPSTFFSNPTGIEEPTLFLWARQFTPAFARAETLVGFCQVFPSTVGTMGSRHARGLVGDSPSRLGWRYVPGEPL